MAKNNIFDVILKTIGDVQRQNKANPNEQTADPTLFDLLKKKLKDLDKKSRDKRIEKGRSPHSILDLIKKEIEGVRKENRKDPKVQTAPKSVFDNIIKKVEERPRRQASAGLRKIVEDYNIDVRRLPREVISQVQQQYVVDRQKFDKQYAKALIDLTKRYR